MLSVDKDAIKAFELGHECQDRLVEAIMLARQADRGVDFYEHVRDNMQRCPEFKAVNWALGGSVRLGILVDKAYIATAEETSAMTKAVYGQLSYWNRMVYNLGLQ